MSSHRPGFDNYQQTLLFDHPDFSSNDYVIKHPIPATVQANVVLLPEKRLSDNKMLVIPVHKSVLTSVPYFSSRLNETHNWVEIKNDSGAGFIKIRIPNDFEVEPLDIFNYIKSLY